MVDLKFYALLVFGFIALGCVEGTVDKPEAPSVLEEERSITEPKGELSDENVADAAQATEQLVNRWGPMCGWGSDRPGPLCSTPEECQVVRCDLIELIRGVVAVAIVFTAKKAVDDSGGEDPDDPGDPTSPTEDTPNVRDFVQRAEGFGRVEKICPGFGSGDRTDPSNGKIKLNIGFTDDGLDAVLWGSFERCRYTTGPLGDILIDGDIVVKTNGSTIEGGPDGLLVIVDIILQGFGGDQRVVGVVSQNFENDELRVFLPQVAGGLVLFQNPEASGFITEAGAIECDFSARVCTRPDGKELTW